MITIGLTMIFGSLVVTLFTMLRGLWQGGERLNACLIGGILGGGLVMVLGLVMKLRELT